MWVDGDYTNPAVPKTSWWNQVLDGVGTFKEGHHEQPLAKDFRMLFFNNAPCSLIVLPEESLFVLTKTKLMWTTCIFIQQVTIRQIHPEIWWLVNLPLTYLHPQKYSSRPYDIRAYENPLLSLNKAGFLGPQPHGVGAVGWGHPPRLTWHYAGEARELWSERRRFGKCVLPTWGRSEKWDGDLGFGFHNGWGPSYALVVECFFLHHFFGGIFVPPFFFVVDFWMCFSNVWIVERPIFSEGFFFLKKRWGLPQVICNDVFFDTSDFFPHIDCRI